MLNIDHSTYLFIHLFMGLLSTSQRIWSLQPTTLKILMSQGQVAESSGLRMQSSIVSAVSESSMDIYKNLEPISVLSSRQGYTRSAGEVKYVPNHVVHLWPWLSLQLHGYLCSSIFVVIIYLLIYLF